MTAGVPIIEAQRLWSGEQLGDSSLVVIDLDATREWPDQPVLPPCPVIGIGEASHPFAAMLDAVIKPPVTLAAVERQVRAQPHAAAIAVQLLRLIRHLPDAPALVAESLAYATLQGSTGHRDWLQARAAPASTEPGHVLLSRAGDELSITLDRASQGNAIDRAMRDDLDEAFALAAAEPAINRIKLRANGRCFSLGADLSEFGTTRDPATAHAIRMASLPARHITLCKERLEVEVQGACVGAGLEIAAWAHRLVARADAWFQLPELAMGILPGAGGCVSLSRRIGSGRTALMLLSGKRIPAHTALTWGLVDAVVDRLSADDGEPDIS